MAVIARPDVIGAVIAHLRAVSELTALTSTRISGAKQDSWQLPSQRCLWVDGPKGAPLVASQGIPLWSMRIDFNAYGPTGLEAMKVWNVLDAALIPDQGDSAQFSGTGVRVINVSHESGPFRVVEPETGHNVVLATYLFAYQAVAA